MLNKNKRPKLLAIVASIAILSASGFTFNAIYQNHQANERIIEQCFENFEQVNEVMLKTEGLFSPVTCEKK